MIYTLGNTVSYTQALAENPAVMKIGRKDGYPGGSVWQTKEEAEVFAPDNSGFSVFGVLADWEIDTAPSMEGGGWHDLLIDAVIVAL